MNLQTKNKIITTFSLASMTDVIFLLLIFFMLTSSFVAPTALPVDLPKTESSQTVTPKVRVTITKKLEYFVNNQFIRPEQIEVKLYEALQKAQTRKIILYIDKSVQVEHLVTVANIANKLNAKIAIATDLKKPESRE